MQERGQLLRENERLRADLDEATRLLQNLNATLDAFWNEPAERRYIDGRMNPYYAQEIVNNQGFCRTFLSRMKKRPMDERLTEDEKWARRSDEQKAVYDAAVEAQLGNVGESPPHTESPKICHCALVGVPIITDKVCELHQEEWELSEFNVDKVRKCFAWFTKQLELSQSENQRLRDIIKDIREAVR